MKKFKLMLLFSFLISNIFQNIYCQEFDYPFEIVKVNCPDLKRGNYIIRNKKDFDQYCPQINTEIDFGEKVLVGIIDQVGGCTNPNINIKVIKDTKAKSINCFVSIEYFGTCRIGFPVVRWIIFRLPEDDYQINVKINKI